MGNVSTTRRKGTTKGIAKELEKYCKPTGLYETCPWEERVVRRWILEGHVAPRFPGSDAPRFVSSSTGAMIESAALRSGDGGGAFGYGSTMTVTDGGGSSRGTTGSAHFSQAGGALGAPRQQPQHPQQQQQQQQQVYQTEECPICFMHYQGVNRTICCAKPLCTECYLQVRPPRSSVVCPFCNCSKFSVEYLGPPSKEEGERRMAEEQCTIEARIHAEQEELMRQIEERKLRDNDSTGATAAADASGGGAVGAEASKTGSGPRPSASSGRLSFATVAERRLTEQQIRNQHIPLPAPGTPISTRRRHQYRRGSRFSARRLPVGERDSDSGSDYQDRHQQHPPDGMGVLGSGMVDPHVEGEIQQVEDLMLMEALRLSVLEEQARRERSGDMRRAAAAAAAATAGGGPGGSSGAASSASLGARLSGSYWNSLLPPVRAASTSATAGDSLSSASASASEPMSFLSGGGLPRWRDVEGIQRDLMATGDGSGLSTRRGEEATVTALTVETSGTAAAPEAGAVEALRRVLPAREQEGRSGEGSGTAASASGNPAPVSVAPNHSDATPPLAASMGERSLSFRQQQQPESAFTVEQSPHTTRAPIAVGEAEAGGGRGGNGNGRSARYGGMNAAAGGDSCARGRDYGSEVGGRTARAAAAEAITIARENAMEGYLSELPESEEEQLEIAIALSLRSSGNGNSDGNMRARITGAGDLERMLEDPGGGSSTSGIFGSETSTVTPFASSGGGGAAGDASPTEGDLVRAARLAGLGSLDEDFTTDPLAAEEMWSITADGEGKKEEVSSFDSSLFSVSSEAPASSAAAAVGGCDARSFSRPPPQGAREEEEVVRKLPASTLEGEGSSSGTTDAFEAAVADFSAFASAATGAGPFAPGPILSEEEEKKEENTSRLQRATRRGGDGASAEERLESRSVAASSVHGASGPSKAGERQLEGLVSERVGSTPIFTASSIAAFSSAASCIAEIGGGHGVDGDFAVAERDDGGGVQVPATGSGVPSTEILGAAVTAEETSPETAAAEVGSGVESIGVQMGVGGSNEAGKEASGAPA